MASETNQPMKLSEAMRLGAMLNPQGFIGDSDGTPAGHSASINGERTCALVAAQRAIGHDGLSWTAGWPWLTKGPSTCPACGSETEHGPFITIIHLNDFHRWTREQIADWVQSIEDGQPPKADKADTESVRSGVPAHHAQHRTA